MNGADDWRKFEFCRTGWIACPTGRPTLELLIEHINEDPRVRSMKIGKKKGLTVKSTPSPVHQFHNGERIPTYEESVTGLHTFIVQSFTQGEPGPALDTEINDLTRAIDNAVCNSAEKVSVFMGFAPYGRGDEQFKGGQPIGAKWFADTVEAHVGSRAGKIMTYDLHKGSVAGFYNRFKLNHLYATALLAIYVKHMLRGITVNGDGAPVVVAADSGGVKSSEKFALYLDAEMAYGQKKRIGDKVILNKILGDVKGRVAIIREDMVDTGSTLEEINGMLYNMGAVQVICAATHGLLSNKPGQPTAVEKLKKARIKLVMTDSIYRDNDFLVKNIGDITQISVIPQVAEILVGYAFGDHGRDVRARYAAVASGEYRYNDDGRLIIPRSAFPNMRRHTIAIDDLSKLVLPNKYSIAAVQRAESFYSARPGMH